MQVKRRMNLRRLPVAFSTVFRVLKNNCPSTKNHEEFIRDARGYG
jgi:hypothetical protein